MNPRQRPDLVFVRDATLGITGVNRFDADSETAVLDRLLLIELKRGDALIVLKHVQQAQQYIQDLLSCGLLDGAPHIRAFVVGHRVDTRLQNVTKIGDPEVARIQAVTFDQLVRTAELRLFGLSSALQGHFKDTPTAKLLDSILGAPTPSLFPDSVESGHVSQQSPKRSRGKKKR